MPQPYGVNNMDRRNSKESMLDHIAYLKKKLEKVYEIGLEGIEYVGAANYAERQTVATNNLNAAYYDEIYSEIQPITNPTE